MPTPLKTQALQMYDPRIDHQNNLCFALYRAYGVGCDYVCVPIQDRMRFDSNPGLDFIKQITYEEAKPHIARLRDVFFYTQRKAEKYEKRVAEIEKQEAKEKKWSIKKDYIFNNFTKKPWLAYMICIIEAVCFCILSIKLVNNFR